MKPRIVLPARQGYDRWAWVCDTNRNPLTALGDAFFHQNNFVWCFVIKSTA